MRNAADPLKKVSLELGGKSPNIFFADADFEAAVDGALFGVFINQGEVCSAGSRVLVQRPIYKKVVDAMVEKAEDDQARPGIDRETKMGPWSARSSATGCPSYQEIGKKEAKVAVGGGRARGRARRRLLRRADDLLRRRQLRPDRPRGDLRPGDGVIPFDGRGRGPPDRQRHAVRAGGGGVEPGHLQVLPGGEALQAGIVWVNHMQPTILEAPWGGYKMTGLGRELGHWGVEEYLQIKQVHINLDETPIAWY